MKTIVTPLGSYLTGTEIADAVSGYGLALARARDLDTVDIPFLTSDGTLSRATIRIGWRVDTATVSAEERDGELHEISTILGLLARTDDLRTGPASRVTADFATDQPGRIATYSADRPEVDGEIGDWDEYI